jgi:phosphate-selective porin OprO/OprP
MSLSLHRRGAILAAAILLPLGVAQAQDAAGAAPQAQPTIQDLLQRIEDQEQKIKVLERKLEITDETAATAKASTPVVKASPKGFSFGSPDGQNQIKLRGTLHFDGRFFESDDPSSTPLTDTWQVTRLRPIVEGTLGGIYDFKFMPDFGQGKTIIQDAYVTARFLPQFQVTAGKFKAPFGLERIQSANDIRFVSRAFPTSLAPNRDLGLQVGGNFLGDRLSYAVSWTNGVNDGSSTDAFGDVDTNSGKEWTARLFAQPFSDSDSFLLRGLGFGIAGSRGSFDGTTAQPLVGSYKTPAQSTFFAYRGGTASPVLANGERTRIGPQFYWYAGRFGLLGEYTEESQDVVRTTVAAGRQTASFDTSAWQLQASLFLTGEEESFRGFKPNNVFSLDNHTWGAFELVARYHVLDPDDDAFLGGAASFADPAVSARKASAYGVGLNWYFNENLKWVLDYEQTSFDGGAAGGADREDEKVFLTRFALGF